MAYLELSLGIGISFGSVLAFLLKKQINSNAILFLLLGLFYVIYPCIALRYLPDDQFEDEE